MQQTFYQRLGELLWKHPQTGQSRWRGFGLRSGQLVYRLAGDVAAGDITLRAMSLVFTTLMAIVPLLAVSFSVLKGFDVHYRIEALLTPLLEPLGDKGHEISGHIIGFVENMRVGVLGSVGLALLFYSAFSLIQKVDAAFNVIWCLKSQRSLYRRMSDYLSVLLIGPVLVFASMTVSASLMNSDIVQQILAVEPFGTLYRNLARLIPYLLIVIAFVFFYMFIPNTRVRLRPALLGGLISGVAWQTCSWAFATFVVSSTKYTAIYSGFAILLFFMIWVYLNWVILLLGAKLVYYLQYPEQLALPAHRQHLSIADREVLALTALCIVGEGFYAGRHGATGGDVNRQLQLPGDLLEEILLLLKNADLVMESLDREDLYVPACPLDATSVKQVMDAIRREPAAHAALQTGSHYARLDALLRQADQQAQQLTGSVTIKHLLGHD